MREGGRMDAAEFESKLPQDLIKCFICKERYRNPVKLPCLHSFCYACVRQLEDDKHQVTCPRCNIQGQSQKDELINSLLENGTVCCKEDAGLDCDLYCETCVAIICNRCCSESHTTCHTVDLNKENKRKIFESLATRLQRNITTSTDIASSGIETCSQVRQNQIKENNDISAEISTFFTDLKTKVLEHLTEKEKVLQLEVKKHYLEEQQRNGVNSQKIKSAKERCESDMEILEILNKREPDVYGIHILTKILHDISACNTDVAELDTTKSWKLSRQEDIIKQLFDLTPADLVLVGKENKITEDDSGSRLGDLLHIGIPTPLDQTIPTLRDTEKGDEQQATPQFYQYADYVGQFDTKSPDDSNAVTPVGMTWVGDKHILLVDRSNHNLKLVAENGTILSILAIAGGEPSDVTHVKTSPHGFHTCAVTIPQSRKLLYLKVFSHQIEVVRTVWTHCGYSCLAHDKIGHALVCGCCPPFSSPAIHIIDVEGVVKMQFVLDSMGQELFVNPRSVDVTDDGTIIVCDWKKGRLVFMKSDGYVLGDYRGCDDHLLKEPIGTTLDGLGNVLVSDYADNAIHIVSVADMKFVGYLSLNRSLSNPREINLSKVNGQGYLCPKLAVASGNSGAAINIFDLWSPPTKDNDYI